MSQCDVEGGVRMANPRDSDEMHFYTLDSDMTLSINVDPGEFWH